MLTFFWIDPRIIIIALSIPGCLYFLCICIRESKILLTHQRPRSTIITEQTPRSAESKPPIQTETSWPFLSQREMNLPKVVSCH